MADRKCGKRDGEGGVQIKRVRIDNHFEVRISLSQRPRDGYECSAALRSVSKNLSKTFTLVSRRPIHLVKTFLGTSLGGDFNPVFAAPYFATDRRCRIPIRDKNHWRMPRTRCCEYFAILQLCKVGFSKREEKDSTHQLTSCDDLLSIPDVSPSPCVKHPILSRLNPIIPPNPRKLFYPAFPND